MTLKTNADREYLLRVIKSSVPGGAVDYKSVAASNEDLVRFRRLIEHGYLEKSGIGCYHVSRAGLQAAKEAEELQEQAAECAEEERKKRFLESKREIAIALISCVAGALLSKLLDVLVH